MLKIRLQRVGRINSPSYRVIVTEHARGPKTGNFVEVVGTYNPKTKERALNADRIKYWISVGAQPSDTMHNMLIAAGITSGKKINVLPTIVVAPASPAEALAKEETSEAPIAEETASEETPAEAAQEEAAVTPAE
jgi:small subunit ribosomal protein S16